MKNAKGINVSCCDGSVNITNTVEQRNKAQVGSYILKRNYAMSCYENLIMLNIYCKV